MDWIIGAVVFAYTGLIVWLGRHAIRAWIHRLRR
jgi:hypothetical protein